MMIVLLWFQVLVIIAFVWGLIDEDDEDDDDDGYHEGRLVQAEGPTYNEQLLHSCSPGASISIMMTISYDGIFDNDDDEAIFAELNYKETFAARMFPSRKWVSGSVLQTWPPPY